MLFNDVNSTNTSMKVTAVLVSAGVIVGIFYGLRKKKGIMPVIGYSLVFGFVGAAGGMIYKNFTNG